VELRPAGGAPFHRTFPQLFALSLAANDPEVAGFGGVALYRAESPLASSGLSSS
jgi:hypothetical protein